jgi:hypothetical protein
MPSLSFSIAVFSWVPDSALGSSSREALKHFQDENLIRMRSLPRHRCDQQAENG